MIGSDATFQTLLHGLSSLGPKFYFWPQIWHMILEFFWSSTLLCIHPYFVFCFLIHHCHLLVGYNLLQLFDDIINFVVKTVTIVNCIVRLTIYIPKVWSTLHTIMRKNSIQLSYTWILNHSIYSTSSLWPRFWMK